MLSTVHPSDVSAGSFQRSPKYLHSSAVWPVCNTALPKPHCLSDSGTDFSMVGAGIIQHTRHKVFRELSFAERSRCIVTSRMVLSTHFLHSMNLFFWRKERQGNDHLSNAASLYLAVFHSSGRLRNDGQVCTTALVGKVGLNLLAVWSFLEGNWVHLQHEMLFPVNRVHSLHNNFRLVSFCLKNNLYCCNKTALFATKPMSMIFLLPVFLHYQGIPLIHEVQIFHLVFPGFSRGSLWIFRDP